MSEAARKRRELLEKSVEELADYFDQTDTSELPLEEATEVEIERPELEQISIRLPKEDIAELKRRASKAGIGYTTLLRMILREHLHSPSRRL